MTVAVVSTVFVESAVREVLSAQMLSHAVESEALVSVLLLQAEKDNVATAIKEKINFFIMITFNCFFKYNNTMLLLLPGGILRSRPHG